MEFLFNKVEFIKKRLQHRCFSVKFVKFLRTLFFTEHLLQLLLDCHPGTLTLRPATLLKRDSNTGVRCFPVKLVKILRTPFFYRTPTMAASGLSALKLALWTNFPEICRENVNDNVRKKIWTLLCEDIHVSIKLSDCRVNKP